MVPVPEPLERNHGMFYLGWVAACVLVALLLPLSSFIFFKVYETQLQAEYTLHEVEQIKKEIERKQAKDKQ
jgi:hypothetical protein